MKKNVNLLWALINACLLGVIFSMFVKEEKAMFNSIISVVFFSSMTIQIFVKYLYKKEKS